MTLSVRGVEAGWGGRPVARLPDLSLAAGEGALLLGGSGSGKTTLLLAIGGLLERTAGSIAVDGVDPGQLRPAERDRWRGRCVGFVFQDLQLVAGLSVLDNLLLAPFAAGAPQDRTRARQLLEQLGLAGLERRHAERLSRGQAQRAALARAMLLRPKLILADEPTASLDDAGADAVSDLLLAAAKETGASLVIATHDSRLKTRFARQVSVEPVT